MRPTDCHLGRAKREQGSQKRQALRSVTIPDKASPFRDDGGSDPLGDLLAAWIALRQRDLNRLQLVEFYRRSASIVYEAIFSRASFSMRRHRATLC